MTKKEKMLLGKEIRKYNHLSYKQRQLCLGTLLGDGSMSPRDNGQCRLRMGHTNKQIDYLEYKKNILIPFIISEKPTKNIPGKSSYKTINDFFIYESIVHQDFTDIYGLFYRGNKKIRSKYVSRKLLNDMDAYALLIWYLDDGCYVKQKGKNKTCRIATNCFSLSENKAIKIWFWQKFKIEAKISYNCCSETYFIRFNVKDSKKLLELFKPYIDEVPECMQYKLKS